jgi:hypothetical protein
MMLSILAKSKQVQVDLSTTISTPPSTPYQPYQPFSLLFGSAAFNSDFPMVCIGVYKNESESSTDGPPSTTREKLDFQLVDFNEVTVGRIEHFLAQGHNAAELFDSAATLRPLREKLLPCRWSQRTKLPVVAMRQLDRDTVFIAYNRRVILTDIEHGYEKRSDLKLHTRFDFNFELEHAVALRDSVLAFHAHGVQGRSLFTGGITQDLCDESKNYSVIGDSRQIVLKTHRTTRTVDDGTLKPVETASAEEDVDLCVLTGHVSTMC